MMRSGGWRSLKWTTWRTFSIRSLNKYVRGLPWEASRRNQNKVWWQKFENKKRRSFFSRQGFCWLNKLWVSVNIWQDYLDVDHEDMKNVEKRSQVNFFPAVVRSNCPHRSWRGKTRGCQACWKVLRQKYLLSQPALHRGKRWCASWDSAGKENENLIQNIWTMLFASTFRVLNCNKSEPLIKQCRLCIFTNFKGYWLILYKR